MKENRYKNRGVIVCETPEQYQILLRVLKQKPLEPRGKRSDYTFRPELWDK